MAYPKASMLIIGLTIIGLVVIAFFGFMAYGTTHYDPTYTQEQLDEFRDLNSSMSRMNNLSEKVKIGLENAQEDTSAISKLEGLASSIWNTFLLTFASGDAALATADSGLSLLPLGSFKPVLYAAIAICIVISLFFVGMYIIFKVKS